ncbi:MAG: PhnA domain-containing protein [Maricaulaceae bacterium]
MATCQLCEAEANLSPFTVTDAPDGFEDQIMICSTCDRGMDASPLDANHWRSLTNTMWNEASAVKVAAYRLLTQLSGEGWAQDALTMLYLDPELQSWADAGINTDDSPLTRDSNGTVLSAGDTVTLIKDLPVKGAGFTAKRGTSVRGISLTDNPDHIEGRVNGQKIVLVAAFLKKVS